MRQYLLPGRTSVVITGTHGKTTTSALTAWLLLDAGRDPGFLVGGEMRNLGNGYRRGRGAPFVLEGDEYNAAFFDRGPKFLHYEPRHLFVGNIEYDHADLYPDLASVIEAFRKVVRLVPEDGVVVLNVDDPRVAALASEARAAVVRVSLEDPGADFSARDIVFAPEGAQFTLLEAGLPTARLSSPLAGRHNVRNALGAIALVRGLGLSAGEIAAPSRASRACKRRMEVKGEKNGILVVDDFAHHPTAVARHARGRPRALSRAPPLGALRAALEHGGPQDVRGRLRRRLLRRPTPSSSRPSSTRSASAPTTSSTAPRSSRASRPRASPPSRPETIAEIPRNPAARGAPGRRAAADVLGRLRRPARDAARKPVTPRRLRGRLAALGLALYLWPALSRARRPLVRLDARPRLGALRRGILSARRPPHPRRQAGRTSLFLRAAQAAGAPTARRAASS